jgi:hypothetical protein
MFGFKSSSKTKRKLTKTPAIQLNPSNEMKILHNIPSVSQIAPLPENRSHGILPILSLDGRDSPEYDDELLLNTDKTNNSQRVGVERNSLKIENIICMFFPVYINKIITLEF